MRIGDLVCEAHGIKPGEPEILTRLSVASQLPRRYPIDRYAARELGFQSFVLQPLQVLLSLLWHYSADVSGAAAGLESL